MHRVTLLASILLGVVSTALGYSAGDASCSKRALNYLACRNRIPHACIPEIASQAVDFCNVYLAVTTTTVVAAPGVTTVTATETHTSEITATETSTSITETTAIEVSTVTTTTATDTTTVTSFAPPQVSVVVPRAVALSGCPHLSEKPLTRLPAHKLSSVCKCLGVTATTVVTSESGAAGSTATESAISTTETTTTVTVVAVSSSTTTTSTTTTTTVSVVATETAVVDACDVSYNPSGNGVGNTILTPVAASARDCCVLCWNTPDCVASAFPSSCQLLVKTAPLDGASTSLTCPLGIENYNFLPGPGVVFVGPCASPP